jgi:hypothetical protein
MNEAVLKWFSYSMIALVVCSSLWLAGTAQALHKNSPRMASSYAPTQLAAVRKNLPLTIMPAERAASAAMLHTVGVR